MGEGRRFDGEEREERGGEREEEKRRRRNGKRLSERNSHNPHTLGQREKHTQENGRSLSGAVLPTIP